MSIRTTKVPGTMELVEDVSTVKRKIVTGKSLEWALATSGVKSFESTAGPDSVGLRLKAFAEEPGLAQRIAVALGIMPAPTPKEPTKKAEPRPVAVGSASVTVKPVGVDSTPDERD